MGLKPLSDTNRRSLPSTMPLLSRRSNNKSIHSFEWPPSPVNDVIDDYISDLEEVNQDAAHIEQLLVNHLRFAHAFRKNDAAMILQFLAKDVTLISVDGARHEGQSAVLAYLVGARMTKISSNLRIKGCPTRSGSCQSTFIYEHGVVFKDPLYMEVVDWKSNSAMIMRIAHIVLPDAKSGKIPQEFGKSSPLRLLFGTRMPGDEELNDYSRRDSDDSELREFEISAANTSESIKVRGQRAKSSSFTGKYSAAMSAVTATSLRLSSSSNSSQSGANDVAVEPLAADAAVSSTGFTNSMPVIKLAGISCTGLTPIRKRKTVNPFVILRCPETGAVWKSPVMRRDSDPKWNQIPLQIPAHKLAKVVEISLWDHTLFRSVKIAGAALVGSDLLRDDTEFSTNIQLEKYDGARSVGESQYVTMRLQFVRPRNGSVIGSSDEVEQVPTQYDVSKTKQLVALRSGRSASCKWLLVELFTDCRHASVLLMLVCAAIVAAIVWNVFHITLV